MDGVPVSSSTCVEMLFHQLGCGSHRDREGIPRLSNLVS